MDASTRTKATGGRLHSQAFAVLKARIEDGEVPPGAHCTVSQVAAQFGISRAPARRALADLERHGIIIKLPGRGYAVPGAALSDAAQPPTELGSVRLTSTSAWERIYVEVENEIIGRISFASWRVKEAELARHYHVSRTVARDVMGRLQQRGLIMKDNRSRWHAPGLTPEHVRELYELRAILEPIALAKAAPHLPARLLARMKENMDHAIARGPGVEGSTLDRLEHEMHIDLLSYCGNRTLMQALTLPQSLLIAHRFLYRWTPRLFSIEPFLAEHLRIIEKLQEGRSMEAAEALAEHLNVSSERALARVEAIRRESSVEELPYLSRSAA